MTRSVVCACTVLALAVPALAESPPKLRDYKVRSGDTCASVAKKLYGSSDKVELIHSNNELGPPPHRLATGRILKVPVSGRSAPILLARATPPPAPAPAPASGPDAHLSFVRNQVDAYTPERHAGQKGDSLRRGNRVNTLPNASAEVTFQDQSRLQLGERTLVVVLGTPGAAAKGTVADTTLMAGTLRAHLGEPVGGKPGDELSLATSGGHRIVLGSGEAQVDVDLAFTARLAVYKGQSRLRSSGREVTVNAGFGSKAEAGKAPTSPRPLPSAPTWTREPPKLVLTPTASAEVEGLYAPGAGGPTVAGWHVQVARDERFNDLLIDRRVVPGSTRLPLTNLAAGEYVARVMAFDADKFEGFPTQNAHIRVAQVQLVAAAPGRRAHLEVPPGLRCGVDGAALREVEGSLELSPLTAHSVRCAAGASDQAIAEFAVPASVTGSAVVQEQIGPATYQPSGAGTSDLTLHLTDGAGAPVVGARVEASARNGTVDSVRGEDGGRYVAAVHWASGTREVLVHFVINNLQAYDVAFTPPPAPALASDNVIVPIPPTGPSPRAWAIEPGLSGGPVFTGGDLGTGGGGGVELGVRVGGPAVSDSFGALVLTVRASYERFSYTRACTTEFCGATSSGATLTLSEDVLLLSAALTYRMLPPEARFTPYLSLFPLFAVARIAPHQNDGRQGNVQTVNRQSYGGGILIGTQVRLGPGNLFLEAGYRYASTQMRLDTGDQTLSGFVGLLGYRFAL